MALSKVGCLGIMVCNMNRDKMSRDGKTRSRTCVAQHATLYKPGIEDTADRLSVTVQSTTTINVTDSSSPEASSPRHSRTRHSCQSPLRLFPAFHYDFTGSWSSDSSSKNRNAGAVSARLTALLPPESFSLIFPISRIFRCA